MYKVERRLYDSKLMLFLSPLIALLCTLLTGGLLFYFLGHNPVDTLYSFFISPLSDVYGWTELAVKSVPLLICAVGLNICFQAKVWNIGAEGQFIMGGLLGGTIALLYPDSSSYLALSFAIIIGIIGGMLWAGSAAWLRTSFNTNEVLTTIMLNYIAVYTLLYAVHGPLRDPEGFNFPQSALFSDMMLLPPIFDDYRMTMSIAFALLALVVSWVLLSRTLLGFQIKVLGEDPKAARFAGFNEKYIVWSVLLISGGLAGLAGIAEVTGPIGQLVSNISDGYGYTAIIVVFMGRMSHIGMLLASMLLGLTYMGGEMVQMDYSLPKSITGLFQGMLLIFLLAADFFISYKIVAIKPPSQAKASSS
jgi:ABC-type uncharacterized transport system permease subunit